MTSNGLGEARISKISGAFVVVAAAEWALGLEAIAVVAAVSFFSILL
ncbi:MAG: hypothetical protein ACPLKZ_02045 [Candidatus Bathyarchaeales archaeon]